MAVCSSCALYSSYLLFTSLLTILVKMRGFSFASVASAYIVEKPNQNFGLLFKLLLKIPIATCDFLEFFAIVGSEVFFVVHCGFKSCMSTCCGESCSWTCWFFSYG